ncbi:hypothetical protein L9F63_008251, partial [Diploptera punctata]
MTWVIADHIAAAGSQELSVHKGQQVEVLELNTATPDWCLVRMPTSGSSVDSPPEGLVPLAVLKQPPPGLKTSPSRRPTTDHDSEDTSQNSQRYRKHDRSLQVDGCNATLNSRLARLAASRSLAYSSILKHKFLRALVLIYFQLCTLHEGSRYASFMSNQ